MWIYIAVFVISTGLIFGLSGCFTGASRLGNANPNDSIFYPTDTSVASTSREEMVRRLQALAESPAPAELSPGAMCYEMAAPPERIEYICPKCGQKTIYTKSDAYSMVQDANACRQLVANIKGLDLRLEEINFCHHCYPKTTEDPKMVLYIRYKGETQEQKVEAINSYKLSLIYAFMTGQTTYAGDYGQEAPLKNYIKEISDILKLDNPKP